MYVRLPALLQAQFYGPGFLIPLQKKPREGLGVPRHQGCAGLTNGIIRALGWPWNWPVNRILVMVRYFAAEAAESRPVFYAPFAEVVFKVLTL